MLSWIRRHKIITTIVGVVIAPALLVSIWFGSLTVAKLRGHWAAYWDVRHGHYRELVYGLAFPERPSYAARLKQSYADSEVVPVAGCIVSSQLQAYVAAYNDYSERAATRHFGHDIFADTWRQTQDDWKSNRAIANVSN